MRGLGISEGIVIGSAYIYQTDELDICELIVDDHENEIIRFDEARKTLISRLKLQQHKADENGDTERKDVFVAHELIVDDPELIQSVRKKIIEHKYCAEWALNGVFDIFINMMERMEDEYLKQRAVDIRDVKRQMIKILMGREDRLDFSNVSNKGSVIVVGREFSPSDIALTEIEDVKGFLSEIGTATTHFSILAKISGIATVAKVDGILELIKHGDLLIIDGSTGEICINPSQKEIEKYKKKQEEEVVFNKELFKLLHEPSVTRDGYKVDLIGNIAGVADANSLNDYGAEGVGLFRTEFIYMDRQVEPTEDEQYEIYKSVLEAMKGKPVVIRTLDVGGDKEIKYLNMQKEDNPFLGYRAIRFCLNELDFFKRQIRAILRASQFGHAKIMIPMISTVEEILETRSIINQCKQELINIGIEVENNVEVGIMIEVPSAGLISDLLAEEVDFFSIGTNDLIQYTMAADRMNKNVSYLYHPYHPAFIRMLKMVIDNAHEKGIKVAMCGELAGDVDFIPVLIGLGLDEFSMNANSLLKSKWVIRKTCRQSAEELLNTLLTLKTEGAIRRTIKEYGEKKLR